MLLHGRRRRGVLLNIGSHHHRIDLLERLDAVLVAPGKKLLDRFRVRGPRVPVQDRRRENPMKRQAAASPARRITAGRFSS
jgi:hypothetical protein